MHGTEISQLDEPMISNILYGLRSNPALEIKSSGIESLLNKGSYSRKHRTQFKIPILAGGEIKPAKLRPNCNHRIRCTLGS